MMNAEIVDAQNDFAATSVYELKGRKVALTMTSGARVLGKVTSVREGRGFSVEVRIDGFSYELADTAKIIAL